MSMQRQADKEKGKLSYTPWNSCAILPSSKNTPKDMEVNWLHEKMERAERDEDMHITSQEWEYGQGCLWKVSFLDYYFT